MKFNLAWSEVLTQNAVLRFALLSLSLCIVGLLVTLTKVASKDPIVIERACYSQMAAAVSAERSDSEVLSFLKEALSMRFDSETSYQDGGLVSVAELKYRDQEQGGFKQKEMKQIILINRIEKMAGKGGEFKIDADRILKVGPVRSALPFPIQVTISSVLRSRGNPYGLRLVQVKPIEVKNEK